MPNTTMNPSHRARRAQIVAEAVVSAYIHEIALAERSRAPAGAPIPRGATEMQPAVADSAIAGRLRPRSLARRAHPALELAA
jgi:hypothetical protein